MRATYSVSPETSKGEKWGEIPTKPPSPVFEEYSFTLTYAECFHCSRGFRSPSVKDLRPYFMQRWPMFSLSDSEKAGRSLG